jgi:hypothetical protein
MTPQHPGSPVASSPSSNPYTLEVKRLRDDQEEKYEIIIQSSKREPAPLKGFFIQAKDEHGQLIGTFEISGEDAKVVRCSKTSPMAAITHTNNNEKTKVEAIWVPPTGHVGAVMFVATVVQNLDKFWTEMSRDIEVGVEDENVDFGQGGNNPGGQGSYPGHGQDGGEWQHNGGSVVKPGMVAAVCAAAGAYLY